MKSLNGKMVIIKRNLNSVFAGKWGIVKDYDGEFYHVAISNDMSMFLFSRKEFKVRKEVVFI